MKIHTFIRKNGFTLIEILVVISIIGVLAAVGAVSYSSAQKRARDADRRTDLGNIASSLEQYYAVCGNVYPAVADGATVGNIICASPSLAILPTAPSDPEATGYQCRLTGGCTTSSYTICSDYMEAEPTRYCVRNQQ